MVGGSPLKDLEARLLGEDNGPSPGFMPPDSGRGQSLCPLLTVAFLNTAARVVAQTPAFCLCFQDFADAAGWEVADTAVAFGRLMALRNLVELCSTPILARWSDRVGRKPALLLCCGACFLESVLLASCSSTVSLGLVYVAGGVFASHNAIEGACIVDSTPDDWQRGSAFGQLFLGLGAALVVGPALGGFLTASSGRSAPFLVAALLSCCSFWISSRMPEYLPEDRRQVSASSTHLLPRLKAFAQLVSRDPRLSWYTCASVLSSLGISAFITVRTIWARHHFGWDGSEIGKVVSSYGLTLMAAQFLLLPLLLWAMQGREALLAMLCLLVHFARFTAYSLAPSGTWLYPTMILSTAGSCSVPVLQGLCSRCVAEDEQSLLSGGTSALNTAAQVLGALLGSSAFATALRGNAHPSSHLLFSAVCFILAAGCVIPGGLAELRSTTQRAARSWVSTAEGMHGADASLPGPTARASMLLRQDVPLKSKKRRIV
mmetsp:Transcript_127769/g.409102  ORF Transcript_127769/g.409102 Transcript_127769/m.409102 type:complete len:488 (+) Transcript_127769:74-1537(+)